MCVIIVLSEKENMNKEITFFGQIPSDRIVSISGFIQDLGVANTRQWSSGLGLNRRSGSGGGLNRRSGSLHGGHSGGGNRNRQHLDERVLFILFFHTLHKTYG